MIDDLTLVKFSRTDVQLDCGHDRHSGASEITSAIICMKSFRDFRKLKCHFWRHGEGEAIRLENSCCV